MGILTPDEKKHSSGVRFNAYYKKNKKMPNFSTIKNARQLTRESSFEDIAQACIEAHYLPPYPGRPDNSTLGSAVNRVHHGGVHASFTALCIDLMLDLYSKYQPEFLVNPDGSKITLAQIKLLKLAAVYHDSANTSEINGIEEEHANLFTTDMLELGYQPDELIPFANAIKNKDAGLEKSKFAKLIQSADCLEIIRVVGRRFDKTRLDIFKDLHLTPGFLQELDQIIENHTETVRLIEGKCNNFATFHVDCELSKNCYLSVVKMLERFFLDEAIKQAAAENKIFNLQTFDLTPSALDLFNRKHSPLARKLIDNCGNPFPDDTAPDAALALYQTEGLLIRVIRHEAIAEELASLHTNQTVLTNERIFDPGTMRRYISSQSDKKFTPAGFKWRPCSYIEKGLPINLFGSGVGVIIDPRISAGTHISFFYKINIASARTAGGLFNYFPAKSGKKERGSLATLRQKIHEQNKRRLGHQHDMNAHYYGLKALRHSEILGTYQPGSVLGIFLTDLNQMKNALHFQTKFGKPIYHYTAETGLVRLSNDLIKQCLLLPPQTQSTRHVATATEKLLTDINRKLEIQDGVTLSALNQRYDSFPRTYQIRISSQVPSITRSRLFTYIYGLSGSYEACFGVETKVIYTYENAMQFIIAFKDDNDPEQRSLLYILKQIEYIVTTEAIDTNRKCMQDVLHAVELNAPLQLVQQPEVQAISPQNPLVYHFSHPVEPLIQCQAYVKNGEPVIQLTFRDGKTYTEKTALLPHIAKIHFKQQAEQLQSLLASEIITIALNSLGITNVFLKFESGYEKSHLRLKFQHSENINVEYARNALLELLKIKDSKPSTNNLFFSSASTSESELNTIKIDDVQNIQALQQTLRRAINQAQKIMDKKR